MLYKNYKNILRSNKIILIISIVLLVLLIPQLCYSQRSIADGSNLNQEELYLRDYVQKLYQEYAEKNFHYIYQVLHPDIKKIISEVEYQDSQLKNFNKYKIQISKIEVGPEIEKINLPNDFTDIIKDTEDTQIYKIPISYEMDLIVAGSAKNRKENNQVYILIDKRLDNHQYFLLWDPTVIKKEEEEEEERRG